MCVAMVYMVVNSVSVCVVLWVVLAWVVVCVVLGVAYCSVVFSHNKKATTKFNKNATISICNIYGPKGTINYEFSQELTRTLIVTIVLFTMERLPRISNLQQSY